MKEEDTVHYVNSKMNQMLTLTVKEFRTTVKTIHSEKRQTMFLMNEILAGKIRSLSREIKTIGKKNGNSRNEKYNS